MYSRVNPDEVVVGWYSTGAELRYTSSLIHLTYDTDHCEATEPLHLLVDTALGADRLTIKGFTAQSVEAAGGRRLFTKFAQAPLDVKSFKAEGVAVDALIKGTPDQEEVRRRLDAPSAQVTEFDDLLSMLTRLREMLDSTVAYTDAVAVRFACVGVGVIGISLC
jgi:translation initiation factor 3 subunit F